LIHLRLTWSYQIYVSRLLKRAQTPFVCLATCLICIFLHEAGHAVAGFLTGGRVTRFVVFSSRPHVRVEGGASDANRAFKSAAGSGFFFAIWFVFILLTPVAKYRAAIETSSFFAFIEGLAWLLSSLIYPHGSRSYDVWKFIKYSGIDPFVVVLGCLFTSAAAVSIIAGRRAQPGIEPL
jgi:hypothetical protein